MIRLEVIHNSDRRSAILTLQSLPSARDVLQAACNKFRLNARKCRLFDRGVELQATSLVHGNSVWLLNQSEAYQGPSSDQFDVDNDLKDRVAILDGSDVWVDPEAIEQVGLPVARPHLLHGVTFM
jgi:hypothetical protein